MVNNTAQLPIINHTVCAINHYFRADSTETEDISMQFEDSLFVCIILSLMCILSIPSRVCV